MYRKFSLELCIYFELCFSGLTNVLHVTDSYYENDNCHPEFKILQENDEEKEDSFLYM